MKNNKYVQSMTFLLSFAMCMPCVSGYAIEETNYKKDESVYVVCNSDGSVESTTVTEWLHSDEGLHNIKDKTNLTNIKNISGDEKPSINGDYITWNSDTNDIYYQGNSDKQLPFSLKVEYRLDGESIEPSDLVGKSGKLEMTIRLENNSISQQVIDNKRVQISPLFPIVMIVNLPNNQFKNVHLSSGTLVAEGKNQIVTFTSILGLKQAIDGMNIDQLNAVKDKLNTSFSISADVNDMDVPSVMLASAPQTFDSQISNINTQQLDDGLNQLKDATAKILDGTVQLKDANIQLNEKMQEFQTKIGEFSTGVNSLEEGSKKVMDGSKQLNDGMMTLQSQMNALIDQIGSIKLDDISQLLILTSTTMEQLKEVPNQLAGMKSQLNTAIEQLSGIKEAILQQCNHEIIKQQIVNKGVSSGIVSGLNEQIGGGIDNIAIAPEQLQALNEQISNSINVTINQQAIDSLKQVLVDKGLSEEEMNALLSGLTPQVSVNSESINTTILSTIDVMKQQLKNSISVKLTESTGMLDEIMATVGDTVVVTVADTVQAQLSGKISELQQMANQALTLLDSMTKNVNTIISASENIDFTTIKQLGLALPQAMNGVQQLVDGSKSLYEGTVSLYNGTDKVKQGTNSIQSAVDQFKDATQKLAESTGELNNGVARFSQEGITKLDTEVSNALNDLNDAMDIANMYLADSNRYTSYGDCVEGVVPSVKFIMKTQEIIKEEEQSLPNESITQDSSLWSRIVNLFH